VVGEEGRAGVLYVYGLDCCEDSFVMHAFVGKAAAELAQSGGEDKAKNNVCFSFALVVICLSRFSTGA
jgi:hypothetical protein